MRLAFVTRKADRSRLERRDPDYFVPLDSTDGFKNVLLPQELSEEFLFLDYAPFGILDAMRGSMDYRLIAFERSPKYVIFSEPDYPGYARIDGILFINASRGAVLIDNKVYTPNKRRPRVLYRLSYEAPWNIPKDLLEEPPRIRAYREYKDPHYKRLAMFVRSYMENRPLVWKPQEEDLLERLLSIENPVFFDLEFDARALKKSYDAKPIIRVASFYDRGIKKAFIRDEREEREFLEDLCSYEELIGYGTSGDEKILRKACDRYGLEMPKIIDLREFIFPREAKKQWLALPVGRKTGLKRVASVLGFRRSSDKDGYRAFKAYLRAKRLNRPERLVRELLYYNIEDTLMTRYVFEKIRRLAERVKVI